MKNIIIVGGGASALAAALTANKKYAVTVLERKDRILKKVLATGNGRCNYTNINAGVKKYHGDGAELLETIFQQNPPETVIGFFRKLGIEPHIKENGKIYPLSGEASSIVDALRFKAEEQGIGFIANCYITDISKEKNRFILTSDKNKTFQADKVILATGGKAYPDLGSNGSGFELAKKLGHTITPLSPALVPLKTEKEEIKGLRGIKANVILTAYKNNYVVAKESGEILFTDSGISGNAVFYISWIFAIEKNIRLFADFLPHVEEKKVTEILKQRRETLTHLNCENFLLGFLHKNLGKKLMKTIKGKTNIPITSLTDEDIAGLSSLIKCYPLIITGNDGFKRAQVTSGGVSLYELEPDTLESKIVKGLYFCGELIDLFGECGGYNLHWAWISGFTAGRAASEH